jgi:RNA polymerase sigma-70 factor (ECF subfamily)
VGELERRSDTELVACMQRDDLAAFEIFFARHRSLIYRTAYGITWDPQAAEEILQDTFARAYRHRRSLRLDMSPVPWLYRVALNLCYSWLNRRRIQTEPIGDQTTSQLRDGSTEPAEHAEQAELGRIVREGIAALPEKHRSVVVCYYLHRLSLQETADLLGLRLGTVKSRLHYALRALRLELERDQRLGEAYLPTTGTPKVRVS